MFELVSDYKPCGDQPKAIERLCKGFEEDSRQVLLGVTGSGKTFTMANIIERLKLPTLVLAHNKTLAAQLYEELKGFFPNNAVEYFVSYYDYYQPEAYIPRSDTFIEKDLSMNEQIGRMRLSATRSLVEREDVIVVASVSCIYGLGLPKHFIAMKKTFEVGQEIPRKEILKSFVELQYERGEDLFACSFRTRGDVIEIAPAYEEDLAIRIELFGDEIERIREIDPLTGKVLNELNGFTLYPATHYVTPKSVREAATYTIMEELNKRIKEFQVEDKLLEAQRIKERTRHDLEMMRQIGYCKGVENYSRHFSGRGEGEPPACLIDYFPEDFLFFIDESHQSLPQLHAMYNGDRARKSSLVDYGFRLPSAYDNRPLKFDETEKFMKKALFVSATPGKWEIEQAGGVWVEQVIRPTGLIDPEIEVRPTQEQVDDVIEEIRKEIEAKRRVLVTTLTKKMAEELSGYLGELGLKALYMHSDIDTLERVQIIKQLRAGECDILVGINLLREGLDMPEVGLVAILDADKEGFLRSATALIQTCGRAARNSEGRVIMYGDTVTDSMKKTIDETNRRRQIQKTYNKKQGITPKTIIKRLSVDESFEIKEKTKEKKRVLNSTDSLSLDEITSKISEYEKSMKKAAKDHRFEDAARYRDLMRSYQRMELELA